MIVLWLLLLIWFAGWIVSIPKIYRNRMRQHVQKVLGHNERYNYDRHELTQADVINAAAAASLLGMVWFAYVPFLIAFGTNNNDGGRRFDASRQIEEFVTQERWTIMERKARLKAMKELELETTAEDITAEVRQRSFPRPPGSSITYPDRL